MTTRMPGYRLLKKMEGVQLNFELLQRDRVSGKTLSSPYRGVKGKGFIYALSGPQLTVLYIYRTRVKRPLNIEAVLSLLGQAFVLKQDC